MVAAPPAALGHVIGGTASPGALVAPKDVCQMAQVVQDRRFRKSVQADGLVVAAVAATASSAWRSRPAPFAWSASARIPARATSLARPQLSLHGLGVRVYHPHCGVPHRAEGPFECLAKQCEGPTFPPATPGPGDANTPALLVNRRRPQDDAFTMTVGILPLHGVSFNLTPFQDNLMLTDGIGVDLYHEPRNELVATPNQRC